MRTQQPTKRSRGRGWDPVKLYVTNGRFHPCHLNQSIIVLGTSRVDFIFISFCDGISVRTHYKDYGYSLEPPRLNTNNVCFEQ